MRKSLEKALKAAKYEGAKMALDLIATVIRSSKGIEVKVDEISARHLTADERLNHLANTLESFSKNLDAEIAALKKK